MPNHTVAEQQKRLAELSQGFDFEGEFTGGDGGGFTPDGLEALLSQEEVLKAKILAAQSAPISVEDVMQEADFSNAGGVPTDPQIQSLIKAQAAGIPATPSVFPEGPDLTKVGPKEEFIANNLPEIVPTSSVPTELPTGGDLVDGITNAVPSPAVPSPDTSQLKTNVSTASDDRSNFMKLLDKIPEVLGTGTNALLDSVAAGTNRISNQFESPSTQDAGNANREAAINIIRPSSTGNQVSGIKIPDRPNLPVTSEDSQAEAQRIIREFISGASNAIGSTVDKGKDIVSTIGDDIAAAFTSKPEPATTPNTARNVSMDLPATVPSPVAPPKVQTPPSSIDAPDNLNNPLDVAIKQLGLVGKSEAEIGGILGALDLPDEQKIAILERILELKQANDIGIN